MGSRFQRGAEPKCFRFSQRNLAFFKNRRASAFVEDYQKNECGTGNQRRPACPEDVALAHASKARVPSELPEMEGAKELSVSRQEAPRTCGTPQFARNGCVLIAKMGNPNDPELLAVVPLPSALERRRREIMLARLMLVAIDLVLSGEGLGLETARDLVREVEHTFPELAAQRDAL
jgi:hypothetical protein